MQERGLRRLEPLKRQRGNQIVNRVVPFTARPQAGYGRFITKTFDIERLCRNNDFVKKNTNLIARPIDPTLALR
jgi:hypothetical protein